MTYNRKAIMARAWEIVKGEYGYYSNINMRYAMCRALSEAKKAVRAAFETPADKIRAAISMLENKSFRYDISAERIRLQAQLEAA